jgi:cell division protein ZapA (FtsZ GTPase activity inhibitor)
MRNKIRNIKGKNKIIICASLVVIAAVFLINILASKKNISTKLQPGSFILYKISPNDNIRQGIVKNLKKEIITVSPVDKPEETYDISAKNLFQVQNH